jgi:hypothetical protein
MAKYLTFIGQGAGITIVQAHADYNNAGSSYVFYTNGSYPAIFKNLQSDMENSIVYQLFLIMATFLYIIVK